MEDRAGYNGGAKDEHATPARSRAASIETQSRIAEELRPAKRQCRADEEAAPVVRRKVALKDCAGHTRRAKDEGSTAAAKKRPVLSKDPAGHRQSATKTIATHAYSVWAGVSFRP